MSSAGGQGHCHRLAPVRLHVFNVILLVVCPRFLEHLVNASILECFLCGSQSKKRSRYTLLEKGTYAQASLVLLEQGLAFIVFCSSSYILYILQLF